MRTMRADYWAVVLVFGAAAAAWAGPLTIVKTLPGFFDDIGTSGINLNIKGDESAVINTTIGNLVFPAGRVAVSNNGGAGFAPPDDKLDPVNEPIPSNKAFGKGQSALAYWDDIGNDVGGVRWQQKRTDAGDVLIIQWHNRLLEGTPDQVRFQIKIFSDPGPDSIYAQFIYDDIERPAANGGVSATIGYQDGGAGFNDVQWSFNTAKAVANATVLSVVPEPQTLGLLALGMLVLARRR